MRILIIENDQEDIKHLEKLLTELAPEKKVVGRCRTVKEAGEWFQTHPLPHLIFSAVQLPDGLSIDMLRMLNNKIPVIFTCTFDKYAIDSFKVQGIDYLMKPVKKDELVQALKRYESNFSNRQNLAEAPRPFPGISPYRERFIVSRGKDMKVISTTEIAYCYTENKIVYLVTGAGEKYTIDFTLEQLEKMLDPKIFFRINRQFVVSISSIVKMTPASKSRLALTLHPETRYGTITSNERTADFRKWLTGIL